MQQQINWLLPNRKPLKSGKFRISFSLGSHDGSPESRHQLWTRPSSKSVVLIERLRSSGGNCWQTRCEQTVTAVIFPNVIIHGRRQRSIPVDGQEVFVGPRNLDESGRLASLGLVGCFVKLV